jgi:uncharacterized protein YbjT (DUF2867 family)
MARYAVVGASRGVGLAITEQLALDGEEVRAISRKPRNASRHIEPFPADVTNPHSLNTALNVDFDAVFFTVESSGGFDGRGLFASREAIRATTYIGCINTLDAIASSGRWPRFILLSAMGADRPSILWMISNLMKAGMRENMIGRERAVQASGLPYVILRSPILADTSAHSNAISATRAIHPLSGTMKIGRVDVAAALVRAARFAPSDSVWDVVPGPATQTVNWWTQEPPESPVPSAAWAV